MTAILRSFVCVSLVAVAGGCGSRPDGADVDQVPIGAHVEVTRADGGVVAGTLTARDTKALHVGSGTTGRSIAREDVASVQVASGERPPVLPAVAKFRELTVPSGTTLVLRLDSAVTSDINHVEDVVNATLTQHVIVDGFEALPDGSAVTGVVRRATPSKNVKGRAAVEVHFTRIRLASDQASYPLSASFSRTAASTKTRDAKTIGIPAAGGAAIGAILGGKKGAGIGAAVGAGAGTAVVLTTAGWEIQMPVGTEVTAVTDQPTEVRVPVAR